LKIKYKLLYSVQSLNRLIYYLYTVILLKIRKVSPLSSQRGNEAGRHGLKGGEVVIVQKTGARRQETRRHSLGIEGHRNQQRRRW